MKIELNDHASSVIHNISIIILMGFALYYTNNLWSFIGCLFFASSKNGEVKT